MQDEVVGRMFTCGWCGGLTVVCPSCDFGNRYCSIACRTEARAKSVKLARQRYAATRHGKRLAADRHQRARDRAKISDQNAMDHPVTQADAVSTMESDGIGANPGSDVMAMEGPNHANDERIGDEIPAGEAPGNSQSSSHSPSSAAPSGEEFEIQPESRSPRGVVVNAGGADSRLHRCATHCCVCGVALKFAQVSDKRQHPTRPDDRTPVKRRRARLLRAPPRHK